METKTETKNAVIQTRVYLAGKWQWIDCEHSSWHELNDDGWEFAYLDYDTTEGAVVAMTKNGYLNEFRNKPIFIGGRA